MNKELIKVEEKAIGNKIVQAVSARDLHTALIAREKFADWIKRYANKFIENQDYTIFSVRPEKGRPSIEYAISLDMAKHIAMLSETKQGHEVRQYFIECEKELKQTKQPDFYIPTTLSEALRLAADQAEIIEKQKPAVEYVDRYVLSKTSKSLRETAKILKIPERQFIGYLQREKILFRQDKSLLPYSQWHKKEYFDVKTGVKNGHVFHQTRVTPEGLYWLSAKVGHA